MPYNRKKAEATAKKRKKRKPTPMWDIVALITVSYIAARFIIDQVLQWKLK